HSGTGWLRELTEERQFGGAVGPIKSDQGRGTAREGEIALRVGRRRRLARIELPVIVEIGKDRRARNVTFDDLLRKQELRGRQIAFGEILQGNGRAKGDTCVKAILRDREIGKTVHTGEASEVNFVAVGDIEIDDCVVAVAGPVNDGVSAWPADDRVIATATGDDVISRTGIDDIVAQPSIDLVIAAIAPDRVIHVVGVDHVGEIRAADVLNLAQDVGEAPAVGGAAKAIALGNNLNIYGNAA